MSPRCVLFETPILLADPFQQCDRCTLKKDPSVVCTSIAGQPPGTRCIQCAVSRRGCSFVTKIKATPSKPSRSKKTVEEEAEVEEEITPPKAKGKGILGALSGRLKRKQGDRSPGEELSNNPPSRSSVRVIVPLPPRLLSDYVQLGARLSQPPFASIIIMITPVACI